MKPRTPPKIVSNESAFDNGTVDKLTAIKVRSLENTVFESHIGKNAQIKEGPIPGNILEFAVEEH